MVQLQLTKEDVKRQQDNKASDSANRAKPAGQNPHHSQQQVKMTGKESKDFRGIVRLLGKDLDGHFPVSKALSRVKGFGHNLSKSIMRIVKKELGVSPTDMIGEVKEETLLKIEEILKDPVHYGVPSFLVNRQKDRESGVTKHFSANDLTFTNRQDLEFEKNIRTYRGWRHFIGQKVRGQHSRTTGRTGMTMGVLKKALKAQKAAAAAGAQESGGKKEEKK